MSVNKVDAITKFVGIFYGILNIDRIFPTKREQTVLAVG